MKQKWMKLLAFLNITKVESSADGIFVKEEDMDKLAAIHDENEQLNAAAKIKDDALTAATTDRDAALAAKKTAEDALATAKTTISNNATEIAALKAKVLNKADDQPLGDGAGAGNQGKTKWGYTKNKFGIK